MPLTEQLTCIFTPHFDAFSFIHAYSPPLMSQAGLTSLRHEKMSHLLFISNSAMMRATTAPT